MELDYLALVLRLMHILAAVTAVGGSIFIRFALLPSLDTLGADQRKALHDAVRARWSRLIQISILFLLVSGVWNFLLFNGVTKTPGWEAWRLKYHTLYQALFGTKFLLASGIFALASILSGRSPGTQKMRDNARFWLNVNLTLAIAVVIISGVMRLTHVGPSLITADAPANRTNDLQPKTGG